LIVSGLRESRPGRAGKSGLDLTRGWQTAYLTARRNDNRIVLTVVFGFAIRFEHSASARQARTTNANEDEKASQPRSNKWCRLKQNETDFEREWPQPCRTPVMDLFQKTIQP
jgi:hypothetical protein